MTIGEYAFMVILFMQLIVAYATISLLKMALIRKERNAEKKQNK